MNIVNRISCFLERLCAKTAKLLEYLLVLFFTIMFIACVVQVFSRYVLNNTALWTDELATYSSVWLNILGGAALVWGGGHAAVTILLRKLPTLAQSLTQIVNYGFILWLCWVILRYGGKVLQVTAMQISPGMHLPMSMVYVSVQVAAVLIALFSLGHILRILVNSVLRKEADN